MNKIPTKKILTIGEVLAEIVATETGNDFRTPVPLIGPFPSGAPAIFIDQVGKLGQPCAIISRVGDDDFGFINLQRLKADGVDISAIEVDPQGVTGTAFVRYRQDGSRTFVFNIRNSACGLITLNDANRALVKQCSHIHVMGTALYAPRVIDAILSALDLIRTDGGTVSFDPNLRPETLDHSGTREALMAVLSKTDLFLPSGDELFLFTHARTEPEAVTELLEHGIKAVILKRGSIGATYFDRHQTLFQPGFDVKEVDPTGAGDCFGATFITCWLEGMTAAEALLFANASGARAVTRIGPMEGASTRAELNDFIVTTPKRSVS